VTPSEVIPAFWPCEQEALRPAESIEVSEWARNIVLLPETSREPGPYDWRRTPYAKAPMDLFTHPDIRHIVLKWPTQVGKTSVLYNILGYVIDQDPYPTMLMYPSDDECKLISRTRVQPMIEASQVLKEKIPSDRSKYQLTEMHFPGMVLYLVSGNSVTAMAQRPVQCLLRDETNKYPAAIGDHGDPMQLSEDRLKGFRDISKIVDVSSPTTEEGNITQQEKLCQAILGYYVPCPHCGGLQILEWEQIIFDDKHELEKMERIAHAKASAFYECKHCGAAIFDKDKDWMLAIESGAGWYDIALGDPQEIDEDPIGSLFERFSSRGIALESIALRLGSSIYSPWLTFGDVVEEFLKAHLGELDRRDKLRNFTNSWLNKEQSDIVEEKAPSDILRLRCDLNPLIVPGEAIALTAGIDHQKKGFYFSVWAWAQDLTRWMIHYGELGTWDDVLQLVYMNAYEVEGHKGSLKIWRAGIDTGGTDDDDADGSMTARVYKWVAKYGGSTVFALKGSNRELPSKVKMSLVGTIPGTKKIVLGTEVRLWTIDTEYFKDLFAAQLNEKHGSPGCVYLHSKTGDDFAKQLSSEAKRRNKRGRYKWVRIHGQNHYLDTSIYAGCLVDPMFLGGLKVIAPARAVGSVPVQPHIPGEDQGLKVQAAAPASRTTRPATKRAMW